MQSAVPSSLSKKKVTHSHTIGKKDVLPSQWTGPTGRFTPQEDLRRALLEQSKDSHSPASQFQHPIPARGLPVATWMPLGSLQAADDMTSLSCCFSSAAAIQKWAAAKHEHWSFQKWSPDLHHAQACTSQDTANPERGQPFCLTDSITLPYY